MKHRVLVTFGINEAKENIHEALNEWQECFVSYLGNEWQDGMIMDVTKEQEKAIRARGFGVREDISE